MLVGQSVAVRLIVEREREVRAFQKREYWTIDTHLGAKKTRTRLPGSRELAIDYAKVRVQFDRPIATFQATTHKAAELLEGKDAVATTAKGLPYFAHWH